jgi:hypothetical protein
MAELVVLLIVVALIVGGVALYRRYAIQQRQTAERAALETQLSTSKRAADEDVTKFGEELQRLDSDVAGHPLDEAMQQDYQRALDAYDNAKMSLDAVTRPEEIRHVTEILEDDSCAARETTSTTSRYPACCTALCCAARTRTPGSSRSTPRRPRRIRKSGQ